ncbi:MAG: hypothetical protein ACRD0H_15590 [Actinomycetes bacterium]
MRIRQLAVLLGAVVVVAGCGVRPIDPVQGGEGPNGRLQIAPVYFLDDQGGLLPIQLSWEKLNPPSDVVRSGSTAVQNLALLIAGPSKQNYTLDARTEVPAPDPSQTGAVAVTSSGGQQLVGVPFEVGSLSERAKQQIACTVLVALLVQASRSQPVAPDVVIMGGSTKTEPVQCSVLPGSAVTHP